VHAAFVALSPSSISNFSWRTFLLVCRVLNGFFPNSPHKVSSALSTPPHPLQLFAYSLIFCSLFQQMSVFFWLILLVDRCLLCRQVRVLSFLCPFFHPLHGFFRGRILCCLLSFVTPTNMPLLPPPFSGFSFFLSPTERTFFNRGAIGTKTTLRQDLHYCPQTRF